MYEFRISSSMRIGTTVFAYCMRFYTQSYKDGFVTRYDPPGSVLDSHFPDAGLATASQEFTISSESPLLVYPPGPFPPQGTERPGTIDLAIRLRDLLYRRSLVEGQVRAAYLNRIASAASDPQHMLMSLPAIDDYLDTWPLAYMIDEARESWTEAPNGPALAVLARCAQVVSSVLGFPQVIDRRWPMPDMKWIRDMAGPGPHAVMSRGPQDGAPAVAVVLNTKPRGLEPVDMPDTVLVHGDLLAKNLDAVLGYVEACEGDAVRFETPRCYDEANQAAYDTLLEKVPAQRAFTMYGHAGLLVPDAPSWKERLVAAPPGTPGPVLKLLCEVMLLPTLNNEGQIEPFGALLWDGPYFPMRVIGGAGEILRNVDGKRTTQELAKIVRINAETVQHLLDQLIVMGACTAV